VYRKTLEFIPMDSDADPALLERLKVGAEERPAELESETLKQMIRPPRTIHAVYSRIALGYLG